MDNYQQLRETAVANFENQIKQIRAHYNPLIEAARSRGDRGDAIVLQGKKEYLFSEAFAARMEAEDKIYFLQRHDTPTHTCAANH